MLWLYLEHTEQEAVRRVDCLASPEITPHDLLCDEGKMSNVMLISEAKSILHYLSTKERKVEDET